LCDRAIAHLSHPFPKAFDEQEFHAATWGNFQKRSYEHLAPSHTLSQWFQSSMKMADKFLPVAFYQVCKQGLEKFSLEMKLAENTLTFLPMTLGSQFSGGSCCGMLVAQSQFMFFPPPVQHMWQI